MRLEWLEDILAVWDTGSFNAAAEMRFLTPSAFTRRVRTIEESLGCELFDRTKKPIVLRPHALECLPDLRDAVIALKKVRASLSNPDALPEQRVSLICQHALTASVAPKLLDNSLQDNKASIRIKSGSMSDCVLSLIRKEAQFALVYQSDHHDQDVFPDNCQKLSLGNEVFLPVVKPEFFPMASEDEDRQEVPIISYPPNIFLGEIQRRVLHDNFQNMQRLVTVAEAGLSLAVVEFVRNGIGVGWLPKTIVNQDLATANLISLENQLPSFELNIILARLNGDLPCLAEEFWRRSRTKFNSLESVF